MAMPLRIVHATPAVRRVSAVLCLVVAGGLLAVGLRHPAGHVFFPRCPTYTFFGIHCAGCGTLRALHALLHADPRTALAHNPLFVVVAPLLAAWVGLHAITAVTGRSVRWRRMPVSVPLVVLVVLLAYSLLRNIPAPSLDWLRPPDPTVETGKAEIRERGNAGNEVVTLARVWFQRLHTGIQSVQRKRRGGVASGKGNDESTVRRTVARRQGMHAGTRVLRSPLRVRGGGCHAPRRE